MSTRQAQLRAQEAHHDELDLRKMICPVCGKLSLRMAGRDIYMHKTKRKKKSRRFNGFYTYIQTDYCERST